jgi:hypothetical protein
VRDVLIVCCDGLTGFPEAIEATWPHSIVQTCTVHLIRAAMRFVSYEHRKKVAAALRPIYTAPTTAPTTEAAESELLAFADSPLGRKYPATVATWENAWERFIPFLAFPPELRRIIYTTDEIVNPPPWSRVVVGLIFLLVPRAAWSRRPGAGVKVERPAGRTTLTPARTGVAFDGGGRGPTPSRSAGCGGCQPCRAALPREGLESRAPLVAATSTPDLPAPALRVAAVPAGLPVGRVGCQAAIVTR